MNWIQTDNEHNLATNASEWKQLHNFAELEDGFGIYIFGGPTYDVRYISSSANDSVIESIAKSISSGKDLGSTQVKIVYTKSNIEAKSLCDYLITKYCPANNADSVSNLSFDFDRPRYI